MRRTAAGFPHNPSIPPRVESSFTVQSDPMFQRPAMISARNELNHQVPDTVFGAFIFFKGWEEPRTPGSMLAGKLARQTSGGLYGTTTER